MGWFRVIGWVGDIYLSKTNRLNGEQIIYLAQRDIWQVLRHIKVGL